MNPSCFKGVSLLHGWANSRNYDVLGKIVQDGWSVEIRQRKAGKGKGSLYKVWTSPKGVQWYAKKKAVEDGFADPEGKVDKLFYTVKCKLNEG